MKILFNKIPLHPPFPKWDLKYSPLWQRGVRGDFKKFPLFHSIFRAKLRDGFTLIEVIVVVAILFILTGAMIPFVYRVWESNEIDTTKERISDLKKAMVGDPRLIQNGVRTHFAFVGDNGQLPDNGPLPGTISNALLPYMPGGYNPNTYNKDAWDNYIIYTPVQDAPGRNVSATLISKGPDGILGNNDDIDNNPLHNYSPELQIDSKEVTPTDRVQGNINIVISTVDPVTPDYAAMVFATYIGASGISVTNSDCIPLSIGSITNTTHVSQNFSSNFAVNLPIGKVLLKGRLYNNTNLTNEPYKCDTELASTTDIAVFVNDGLNTVSVNLPTINYTITVP